MACRVSDMLRRRVVGYFIWALRSRQIRAQLKQNSWKSLVALWGKGFPGRGNRKDRCDGPEEDRHYLVIGGAEGRLEWLEQSEWGAMLMDRVEGGHILRAWMVMRSLGFYYQWGNYQWVFIKECYIQLEFQKISSCGCPVIVCRRVRTEREAFAIILATEDVV